MMTKTKNFAHRGFSGAYPENTMLAFEKAIEAGCDGIELDVHLTKDGEVVIIHDELLDRTTDATGLVSDYTLQELQKVNAAKIHRRTEEDFCGIPTLEAYFQLVKDTQIITNIELKTGVNPYPGIEEKVLHLIDKYELRERIIISSFNHYSVLRMKELAPDMEYGFLEESWLIHAADYTSQYGAGCMHPYFYVVTEDYVKEAKEKGLKINTWTVNTESDMRDMLEKGVDSIIGNYPDLCRKIISEYLEE